MYSKFAVVIPVPSHYEKMRMDIFHRLTWFSLSCSALFSVFSTKLPVRLFSEIHKIEFGHLLMKSYSTAKM